MVKIKTKKFNPSVRNAPTFGKKKVKVGRQLRRENATNTTVRAKRITLVQQMSLAADDGDHQRGQPGPSQPGGPTAAKTLKNLQELAPQLGHYNENLCRDAIAGVRNHFKQAPEHVGRQLRTIIPGVGSLLVRELKQTATRNQLKRLIEQICDLPAAQMSSHFRLFCQFVLTGVTDIRPGVRALSFDVLFLLMKKYQELCAGSEDIFNKYLQLLSGQRLPINDRPKLLDSMLQFVIVFSPPSSSQTSLWPLRELHLSFSPSTDQPPSVQLLPRSAALFHFPVLYASKSGGESPMETREGMENCCRTLCAFLAATIHEEEAGADGNFNAIITRVYNIVSQFADVVLQFVGNKIGQPDDPLRTQLAAAFTPLKKCPAIGGSKKLMTKLEAIAFGPQKRGGE